jgi:hypothetical protein
MWNKAIELDSIGAGDYFGEMALFGDDRRSATIQVKNNARFLTLHKQELQEIVREYPQIALHVCRVLSMRIRRLHGKFRTTAAENDPESCLHLMRPDPATGQSDGLRHPPGYTCMLPRIDFVGPVATPLAKTTGWLIILRRKINGNTFSGIRIVISPCDLGHGIFTTRPFRRTPPSKSVLILRIKADECADALDDYVFNLETAEENGGRGLLPGARVGKPVQPFL